MAGSVGMALRVIYLAFVRFLGLLVLLSRSQHTKDVELLALRHVVQRRRAVLLMLVTFDASSSASLRVGHCQVG
jgi:Mg-chelatase subunit ChlD